MRPEVECLEAETADSRKSDDRERNECNLDHLARREIGLQGFLATVTKDVHRYQPYHQTHRNGHPEPADGKNQVR